MQVMQAEAGAPLIPPRTGRVPDAVPAVPATPTGGPARSSPSLFAVLVAAAVTVYTADQLTKAWAAATLPPERAARPGRAVLQLNLIRNPGAAFSIGTGYTWVLTARGLQRRRGDRGRAAAGWAAWGGPWALGLLLGGALGNLTDRLVRAARARPRARRRLPRSCRTGRSSTSPTRDRRRRPC